MDDIFGDRRDDAAPQGRGQRAAQFAEKCRCGNQHQSRETSRSARAVQGFGDAEREQVSGVAPRRVLPAGGVVRRRSAASAAATRRSEHTAGTVAAEVLVAQVRGRIGECARELERARETECVEKRTSA